MTVTSLAPEPARRRYLAAALTTFLRYGFRKTSMEEVARGAGISRQALYAHFATKDELFRATVEHALEDALEAASACLASDAPIEARLVGALDAWTGRYVGMMGGDVTDLKEAMHTVGPVIEAGEARFGDALIKAIRASGLVAAYKPAGLSAKELASTLAATARGLKTTCTTREAFVAAVDVAVRALCLPLHA